MFGKIYKLIEKPFLVISALASILSVVLLCFNDTTTSIIAICSVCVALTVLLVALLRTIFRYTEQTNRFEYRRIATFIDYKTINADIIEFQTYRVIQVKTPILQSIDIEYHWSGKHSPKITSDLQTIESINAFQTPNGYSKARLHLSQPKLYNETAVFQHKITANDLERASKTKVELKIDDPIDLVQVNISLGYKPSDYNESAIVERAPILNNRPPEYEHVEFINFDNTLKEYTYTLRYPEPGYFYRISWKR